MVSPPTQALRIPRSLTAPDAWISIFLVSYLQYRQYARRQYSKGRGKIHAGAKSKPERKEISSLVHECLFTYLHMLVSPFSGQASELNANMVDLQSDQELEKYANDLTSGKNTPMKTRSKSGKGSDGNNEGGTMAVRSRRIMRGEMVYNAYFPVVETALNLAISISVGLASRWLLGLIRSLNLSRSSGYGYGGGPCCSPYRG